MKNPTRRHRSSDQPVRGRRTIAPYQIDPRYIAVLQLLEPYHYFKFATIPWLHYLSGIDVEFSVFRKYLGYLRQAPNHYLSYPEQQNASPNVPYKTIVYELGERGLNELINRGIISKRNSSRSSGGVSKITRNFPFALHRAHSYYHEIIVDLGYFAPMRHWIHTDANLRFMDFVQLLAHPNVPSQTRDAADPLLIELKTETIRFDGTPHLLIRQREDGVSLPLGIPGIQVDRGTESFPQIEKHLRHALEFVDDRHFERRWGFDNCVIPFLFTRELRKARAMEFVQRARGKCAFLLFQTIADIGLLPRFPKPEDYDRTRQHATVEGAIPDNIRVFTNPWQRVGFSDFYLNTFSEKAPT